jgi:hypothetical protein
MTTTTTTTATVTASLNAATVKQMYGDKLKGWSIKTHGDMPSPENFAAAHALGAKVGSKTALAIAMYLRDAGITQGQMANALGGPYLNKARDLVTAKLAVRVPMPQVGGHTVYKLALPQPKATASKATKAASKGNGKAKQATASKAKPTVTTPVVEPATPESGAETNA